jgi:hypothetical protein
MLPLLQQELKRGRHVLKAKKVRSCLPATVPSLILVFSDKRAANSAWGARTSTKTWHVRTSSQLRLGRPHQHKNMACEEKQPVAEKRVFHLPLGKRSKLAKHNATLAGGTVTASNMPI